VFMAELFPCHIFWCSRTNLLLLFFWLRFRLVLRNSLLKSNFMQQFNCMLTHHWCLSEKVFKRWVVKLPVISSWEWSMPFMVCLV
jgi:hypothetical protein